MENSLKSPIVDTKFIPFEDFVGIGTKDGFQNACIPGSGIANFDSFEANPFITTRQRQEQEVKNLLDKLPADTIVMNPHDIGTVDKAEPEVIKAEEKALREEMERKMREKSAKKRKRKEDKGKIKNSAVHDKKTREKIQETIREKEKDQIDMRLKAAKDIQFLTSATTDLLGMPTKKSKLKEL